MSKAKVATYRVCLQELVDYELFIVATSEDAAAEAAWTKLAAFGPIQRDRAVTGVVAREVTACREWSA